MFSHECMFVVNVQFGSFLLPFILLRQRQWNKVIPAKNTIVIRHGLYRGYLSRNFQLENKTNTLIIQRTEKEVIVFPL